MIFEHLALVRQDLAEARDLPLDLAVLLDDLVALEAGQALQAHVEDGLRLDLREAERGDQPLARRRRIRRRADDRDGLVEIVDRDLQPGEDVQPLLRLAQLEDRAAVDDLAAVLR